MARLVERNGLVLAHVRRSFVFDILIAHSCRELRAVLVSRNSGDLERIATVFPFDHVNRTRNFSDQVGYDPMRETRDHRRWGR